MFAITRRGGLKAIHSPAWRMGWEIGWRQNLNHRDLIEHRVVLCVVSSISTTLRWPDSLVVRQKGRTATMDVWLRVSAFVISYAISSEYIECEPRALFHTAFVKRTRLNPRSISVFFSSFFLFLYFIVFGRSIFVRRLMAYFVLLPRHRWCCCWLLAVVRLPSPHFTCPAFFGQMRRIIRYIKFVFINADRHTHNNNNNNRHALDNITQQTFENKMLICQFVLSINEKCSAAAQCVSRSTYNTMYDTNLAPVFLFSAHCFFLSWWAYRCVCTRRARW